MSLKNSKHPKSLCESLRHRRIKKKTKTRSTRMSRRIEKYELKKST